MKLFSKDPVATILFKWLKALKIKATYSGIYDELQKHSYPQNLYAIIDILRTCDVDSIPVRIDKSDITQIKDIPTPFLAHTQSENGQCFVIVHKLDSDKITYEHPIDGNIYCPVPDFVSLWTGILLFAFPTDNAQEAKFEQNKQKETWYILFSIALIGIVILGLAKSIGTISVFFDGLIVGLTALSCMIGLLISYILILDEWNPQNSVAQKLCAISHSECGTVTSKKEVFFNGLFGWAELGFLYFLGNTLYVIIFMTENISVLPLLWDG